MEETSLQPPQHQEHKPGREEEMRPQPRFDDPEYRGSGKLRDKIAVITGGDSGIGRAVSVIYAKEEADVVIVYLNEHEDADKTRSIVEGYGRRCLTIAGDISGENFCSRVIEETVKVFGRLDVLVNNAAEHYERTSIRDISAEQLEKTFRINVFSMFYLVKAALPHMRPGGAIINTTSVTAYRGSGHLLDYSSSKGAVVTFTRSLSESLLDKGIRVNAVAPGPIWTPLIPATFEPDHVAHFGEQVPMGRPGQPFEVAPCYVFLASRDSSYMTGQVLHPNGGRIVNG